MTEKREKRPRVLEVPRDREAEKALAGMAGLSLTQFRRICCGIDLQCLACGKILHSPPRMLPFGGAGISICYEDAFGDEWRGQWSQSGLLVNMTNDAWYDDSPMLS